MDFSNLIEDNRRELITDVLYRINDKLRPFHESLYAFLATLFLGILPDDWREQWHTFVSEQEAEGFTIAQSSIAELETWIEAWAKDCKLWAEEPERFPDEEGDEESESTFIISVIPDVSGPQGSTKPIRTTSHVSSPKIHLPADYRGSWTKGVKGNGTFTFNNSAINQQSGIAGKSFRFQGNNIARGGFPKADYYGGSARAASVPIRAVSGTSADALAADAAMRIKLGNSNWSRPPGYVWNHAGADDSTTMELVNEATHQALAHRGPSAKPRAALRATRSSGTSARAVAVFTVYMNVRDILRGSGVLQPEYVINSRADYYYKAEDGSVFVVWPNTFYRSGYLEFISGSRKGKTIVLTKAQVARYRDAGEKKWGKYMPETLFREPKFLPGTELKSLTLYEEDRDGTLRIVGWIDEEGVHYYTFPGPKMA